jgi:hypothetical protein
VLSHGVPREFDSSLPRAQKEQLVERNRASLLSMCEQASTSAPRLNDWSVASARLNSSSGALRLDEPWGAALFGPERHGTNRFAVLVHNTAAVAPLTQEETARLLSVSIG